MNEKNESTNEFAARVQPIESGKVYYDVKTDWYELRTFNNLLKQQ